MSYVIIINPNALDAEKRFLVGYHDSEKKFHTTAAHATIEDAEALAASLNNDAIAAPFKEQITRLEAQLSDRLQLLSQLASLVSAAVIDHPNFTSLFRSAVNVALEKTPVVLDARIEQVVMDLLSGGSRKSDAAEKAIRSIVEGVDVADMQGVENAVRDAIGGLSVDCTIQF